METSFKELTKKHVNIDPDEIAQLSLISISQLKFLQTFHEDIADISSSHEQIDRSNNIKRLINDILKQKELGISYEGRLSTDIDFNDRLETQALLHITRDYDVKDFRKAIDSMFLLKQKSKNLNLTPVKHFDHNYYEGITHLLSVIGNKRYSSISVIPHTQGYLPSSLDDIKGSHTVYATGSRHQFLLTFTDELSQEDFEKYRIFNLNKAKEYRQNNDHREFDHNIIEYNLREADRKREIKDYFNYNPNLKDYLLVQDIYDFDDQAYRTFKRDFVFKTDDLLKKMIDYDHKYHSSILNLKENEILSPDDKETVILNTAITLLLNGPDRTLDIDGNSPIKNMLLKEIQKEEENKFNNKPFNSTIDIINRQINNNEVSNPLLVNIFQSVLDDFNKKHIKFKI